MRSMKNLSANMDLRNLRIKGLAKAIIMNYQYSFVPPDKSGGYSECSFKNGGNSRLGDALIATGFSLWNNDNVSVSGFSQRDILQGFIDGEGLAKAIVMNDENSFVSPDKSGGNSDCSFKNGGNSEFGDALIATGFSLWNDNNVSVSGFSQRDTLQGFIDGEGWAKAIIINYQYSFVPPDKSGGNSGLENSLIATGFSLWYDNDVNVSGFSQKNLLNQLKTILA